MTKPHFLCRIIKRIVKMNKERIKLIIKDLELLIDSLKTEIYSDIDSYKVQHKNERIVDYDEIFEDDE